MIYESIFAASDCFNTIVSVNGDLSYYKMKAS